VLLVDFVMEDGNKVLNAVIFENEEVGAKAINDYDKIEEVLQNSFKDASMIHYNTKYMSGKIISKSIVTYEIKKSDKVSF